MNETSSATPKSSIYQLTHAEVKTLAQGGTVSITAGSLIAMPSPNHPSALVADLSTPKPRAGEHTPGPWTVHEDAAVIDRGLGLATIAHCYDAHVEGFPANRFANARRIVACVNFCDGVSTEEIEAAPAALELRQLLAAMDKTIPNFLVKYDQLRAREKELVEALEKAASALHNDFEPDNQSRAYLAARAALSKVRP